MGIPKPNRQVLAVCLLALIFAGTSAHAIRGGGRSTASTSSYSTTDTEPANTGLVGFGYLDHDAGVAATDASSGSKPFWNDAYLQFSIQGKFKTYEEWSLSPILIFSILDKKSNEGGESSNVKALGIRAYHPLGAGFDAHVGPGILDYEIKGSGGTVTLSNGSGTAKFGIPDQTKSSTLLYWDFGAGYRFGRYHFETSVLITSIFSSQKRAMSPVISFSSEVF